MSSPGPAVVIVGAGGNICSHLVPLIGRMSAVRRVLLVDHDTYEEKNLAVQDILPDDVGHLKVEVQAKRLRSIDPAKQVEIFAGRVQHLPLACLRADVIVAGLDDDRARIFTSAMAWRLGVPYIDAGVKGDAMLVRLSVQIQGEENSCIQCSFPASAYAALAGATCVPDGFRPPPTNSPAMLGALAASLAAIECGKVVAGQWKSVAQNREILVDSISHQIRGGTVLPSPECKFDHHSWVVIPLQQDPDDLTLEQVLALGEQDPGTAGARTLKYEGGSAFAVRLTCSACGFSHHSLHLEHRLPVEQRACPDCGEAEVLTASSGELMDRISLETVEGSRSRTLASLGFQARDIFSTDGTSGERHYEITGRLTESGAKPGNGGE